MYRRSPAVIGSFGWLRLAWRLEFTGTRIDCTRTWGCHNPRADCWADHKGDVQARCARGRLRTPGPVPRIALVPGESAKRGRSGQKKGEKLRSGGRGDSPPFPISRVRSRPPPPYRLRHRLRSPWGDDPCPPTQRPTTAVPAAADKWS